MSNDRYEKHMLLEEIGKEGQERLMGSSVAIIGCGALGSMIATLLVRAGVGRIIIVDRDFVEMKNLHRQILFDEEDAENMIPKAMAAMEKLRKINSEVEIEARVIDINPSNIEDVIGDADLIMDGTDNMETRFLINDACIKYNKPWIYGAVMETEGMTMNIIPGITACLRCFIPPTKSMETCDTSGVLSAAATLIASLQITEAIKILSGRQPRKEALHVDVWHGVFTPIMVERNKECITCGRREYEFLNASKHSNVELLCDGKTIQITPMKGEISLEKLAERLRKVGEVKYRKHVLKFKAGKEEMIIFEDGRALVLNAGSVERAKALYARYVGM